MVSAHRSYRDHCPLARLVGDRQRGVVAIRLVGQGELLAVRWFALFVVHLVVFSTRTTIRAHATARGAQPHQS